MKSTSSQSTIIMTGQQVSFLTLMPDDDWAKMSPGKPLSASNNSAYMPKWRPLQSSFALFTLSDMHKHAIRMDEWMHDDDTRWTSFYGSA